MSGSESIVMVCTRGVNVDDYVSCRYFCLFLCSFGPRSAVAYHLKSVMPLHDVVRVNWNKAQLSISRSRWLVY